jgi:hypothetical protein
LRDQGGAAFTSAEGSLSNEAEAEENRLPVAGLVFIPVLSEPEQDMSTIFDSSVYQMRKNAPFAAPQMGKFIEAVAIESPDHEPAILTVQYRHSVASRLWWTLEWTDQAGQKREVSAQEWPLCVWRAIQVYKNAERQRELERQPVTKGPGFFSAEAKGWEGGDGI